MMRFGPFDISLAREKTVRSPQGDRIETKEHGTSAKDPFGTAPGDYRRGYISWLGQFDPEKTSLMTIKKVGGPGASGPNRPQVDGETEGPQLTEAPDHW